MRMQRPLKVVGGIRRMRTEATATTTSRETAAEIFVVTRRGTFAGRTSGRMDIWYAPKTKPHCGQVHVGTGMLYRLLRATHECTALANKKRIPSTNATAKVVGVALLDTRECEYTVKDT